MKTQAQICKTFDQAVHRLTAHNISVLSDDMFFLMENEKLIGTMETTDGLTSFADALDYARGAA